MHYGVHAQAVSMHRADPPRGNEMQTDPASVLPNQCSPKQVNATMCSKMQLIVTANAAVEGVAVSFCAGALYRRHTRRHASPRGCGVADFAGL